MDKYDDKAGRSSLPETLHASILPGPSTLRGVAAVEEAAAAANVELGSGSNTTTAANSNGNATIMSPGGGGREVEEEEEEEDQSAFMVDEDLLPPPVPPTFSTASSGGKGGGGGYLSGSRHGGGGQHSSLHPPPRSSSSIDTTNTAAQFLSSELASSYHLPQQGSGSERYHHPQHPHHLARRNELSAHSSTSYPPREPSGFDHRYSSSSLRDLATSSSHSGDYASSGYRPNPLPLSSSSYTLLEHDGQSAVASSSAAYELGAGFGRRLPEPPDPRRDSSGAIYGNVGGGGRQAYGSASGVMARYGGGDGGGLFRSQPTQEVYAFSQPQRSVEPSSSSSLLGYSGVPSTYDRAFGGSRVASHPHHQEEYGRENADYYQYLPFDQREQSYSPESERSVQQRFGQPDIEPTLPPPPPLPQSKRLSSTRSVSTLADRESTYGYGSQDPVKPSSGDDRTDADYNDDEPPGERDRDSRKRTKTLIACTNCRRRKLRCDGQKPQCGSCGRRANDTCQYEVHIRRRGPGKAPKGSRPRKRKTQRRQNEGLLMERPGTGQSGFSGMSYAADEGMHSLDVDPGPGPPVLPSLLNTGPPQPPSMSSASYDPGTTSMSQQMGGYRGTAPLLPQGTHAHHPQAHHQYPTGMVDPTNYSPEPNYLPPIQPQQPPPIPSSSMQSYGYGSGDTHGMLGAPTTSTSTNPYPSSYSTLIDPSGRRIVDQYGRRLGGLDEGGGRSSSLRSTARTDYDVYYREEMERRRRGE